jgi:peroxiredoxin Q/BCP
MRNIYRSFLMLAVAAPLAAQGGAQMQGAAASVPAALAPAIGDVAPDFTAQWADSAGTRGTPVSLSQLRGKVVVIAFYPKDRTSGCTAEMTKFTNEYKTLFGDGVVLLPTSMDSLGSHTSWAKDMHMPFALVSDPEGKVAQLYASQRAPGAGFTRNTFVIGKDGKVAYAVTRFNAMSEDAYTQLAVAIAAAKK